MAVDRRLESHHNLVEVANKIIVGNMTDIWDDLLLLSHLLEVVNDLAHSVKESTFEAALLCWT